MSNAAASVPSANKQQWRILEPLGKEDNFLQPVPPFHDGEGFPYAPTDWPNPGDTWGWRVGGRISSCGYYTDRFLIPPMSLQKAACPKKFASKRSLEHYILREFPSADIDAFFASFIWRIPSTLSHSTKEKAAPISSKKVEQEWKEETVVAVKRKTKHTAAASSAKRQTRVSLRQSVPVVKKDMDGKFDACSLNKEAETSNKCISSDFEDNQPDGNSDVDKHSPLKCIPENFDSYLNSLDDILVRPLFEASLANAATINSATQEDELAEAPSKLSSLLDMDFPSLVSSKNIYELIHLASNLQKDPNLSAEKLLKLKLIEEIPSYGKVFLENKRITEQAKNFFAVLEDKTAKVLTLRREYNDVKGKASQVQSELDSNYLAIKEIDNQIAKLQSQRVELMSTVDMKKKTKAKLTIDQEKLANAIQKKVHEVQLANSKKAEWELKKENAAKREAEILARFGPLKGFSL